VIVYEVDERVLRRTVPVRDLDSLLDVLDHPTFSCSSLNQQTVRFQCWLQPQPHTLLAYSIPLEPPPISSSHVPAWPYN